MMCIHVFYHILVVNCVHCILSVWIKRICYVMLLCCVRKYEDWTCLPKCLFPLGDLGFREMHIFPWAGPRGVCFSIGSERLTVRSVNVVVAFNDYSVSESTVRTTLRPLSVSRVGIWWLLACSVAFGSPFHSLFQFYWHSTTLSISYTGPGPPGLSTDPCKRYAESFHWFTVRAIVRLIGMYRYVIQSTACRYGWLTLHGWKQCRQAHSTDESTLWRVYERSFSSC